MLKSPDLHCRTAGTIGQMDCVYSYWTTRRPEGFDESSLAAMRDLPCVLVPGGVTLPPESGEDAGKVQTLGARFAHGQITLEEAADLGCRACASPGAISSNTARCLSMSASVCCTEIVHCSSHQYG